MFFQKNKSEECKFIEKLYEQHKHFLFFVANCILNDDSAAEDIVHDTLMKATKHLSKFDYNDLTSAKNYLATICKNSAIDAYNKRKHIIPLEDLESYTPDSSYTVNPEEYLTDKESYINLVNQITNLPEKYRNILIMHRVKGHTPEEISRLLNISIDATYKRLQRGKSELSKRLEEEVNNNV